MIQEDKNLDLLIDLPLKLSVEIGRTRMPIRELLELGNGSILPLDKLASEPLDIIVNGKLIGRGVAVVVNGKFGIRVTEIIGRNTAEQKIHKAG